MLRGNELLTIGELAARTGLSVSARRFYEKKGLVHPIRTTGNQRRLQHSRSIETPGRSQSLTCSSERDLVSRLSGHVKAALNSNTSLC